MGSDKFYLHDNILVARDLEPVAETGSSDLGALAYYDHPTYGGQVYRRILNSDAASLVVGEVAMIKSGQSEPYVAEDGAAATPACRVLGVAQTIIPTGYTGWVLAQGKGLILSNGTTTTHTAQTCAAAGEVTDGTIGTNEMVAFALAANAVATTTSVARICVG